MKKKILFISLAFTILNFILVINISEATPDTFGKTNVGSSSWSIESNRIWVSKYSLDKTGNATEISVHGRNKDSATTANVALGIYNSTFHKVAQTQQRQIDYNATRQWYNFTISPSVHLKADDYYIVFWWATQNGDASWDPGSTDQSSYHVKTYDGALPSSITLATKLNRAPSVYVTYTPDPLQFYNTGISTTIAGAQINFYTYVETLNGNLSHYIFGTDNSGTWYNDIEQTFSEGLKESWINITDKILNSTIGKIVNWQIWVNNTNGEWGTTALQTLITTSTAPTYSNLLNYGHKVEESATFKIKWTAIGDQYPLSHSIFSWNNSGTWQNFTISLEDTEGWHNITMTLNSSNVPVQYKFYANSSNNHWNQTDLMGFRTYNNTYALHVEGNKLVNDEGDIVYLRGVNKHGFEDYPVGIWNIIGSKNVGWGYWNESNVKAHLDAMKIWGFNNLRVIYVIDFWKNNETADRLEDLAKWSEERGMYFTPVGYEIIKEDWDPMPYYPYFNMSEYGERKKTLMPNKEAFVDFIVNVTKRLCKYSTTIIDIWNEPVNITGKADWFDANQKIVNQVRQFCDNILILDWNYDLDLGATGQFDWIQTYTVTGTNLLYTIDAYDDYNQYSSDYETLKSQYHTNKVDVVVNDWNLPLYINEIGASVWLTGEAWVQQINWFKQSLRIFNEWNISWAVWWWWQSGKFQLFKSGTYMTPPTETGLAVIQAMHETPFVWTAGNETMDGQPYIYSNNIPYNEQWLSEEKKLKINMTGFGNGWLRVFWNYPMDSNLRIRFSNGTLLNAQDYWNSTTKLITIPITF